MGLGCGLKLEVGLGLKLGSDGAGWGRAGWGRVGVEASHLLEVRTERMAVMSTLPGQG